MQSYKIENPHKYTDGDQIELFDQCDLRRPVRKARPGGGSPGGGAGR
jgi:hypothetical protein